MIKEARDILKKYWGYDDFRHIQEEIITSVMEGKDTLGLMPTGGGKSVCFQVPGMMKDGICLVITPLIALMVDQVRALTGRGIKAVAIHSGMHYKEIELALDKCIQGNVKFLYISPERLETRRFLENLRSLKISLIAVDEAHCISQWGYDFRPPYLRVAQIRQFYPDVPLLALTATAVEHVVKDIQARLLFRKENVKRYSFERKNLAYVVSHEEDKLQKLFRICNSVKGCGIVYVRNRRETQEVTEYLNRNHIPSGYYHAGLEPRIRNLRQESWMKGEIRVIVATNAFGMGIDKADVRFVVHLDLPDSIEAYFQEAGRAGRDGKKSYSVILMNNADPVSLRYYVDQAWPLPAEIRSVYAAIGNFFQVPVGSGQGLSFDFDLNTFANSYNMKTLMVFYAVKILEREGYFVLTDPLEDTSTLLFTCNKEELYNFQLQHIAYDPLIKTILRSYSGTFTEFTHISENEIARRINQDTLAVIAQLNKMQKLGILEYIPRKTSPQLIFNIERVAEKDISFTNENYFQRKREAIQRVETMIGYAESGHICRSRMLLNYFGENSASDCGICDVCIEKRKKELHPSEFQDIEEKIAAQLVLGKSEVRDLVNSLNEIDEDVVLSTLRLMLDNGKIKASGERFYILNDRD